MGWASEVIAPQSALGCAGLGVVDPSAELTVELQSARDALAAGKLARANRIADRVLEALDGANRPESGVPSPRRTNPELIRASAFAIRGRVALQTFRPEAAAPSLATAVTIWSRLLDQGVELDPAGRAEYLELLLLSHQGELALDELGRMLDSGAEVPVEAVLRVAKWLESHDPPRAVALLRAAAGRRPVEPLFPDAIGVMLEQQGLAAEAAAAHFETAVLLAGQSDLIEAEEHLERALRCDPGLTPAASALARVRLWQDRPQAALEALDMIAALDTPDLVALQAYALWLADRIDAAFDVVRSGVARLGAEPELVQAKVQLELAVEDYPAALRDLRELGADQAEDPTLRLLRARALIGLGEAGPSLDVLGRLGDEFPDNATIPALVAQASAMAGQDDEALAAMLQAVSAGPEDRDVLRVRKWLVTRWTDFATERVSEPDDPGVLRAVDGALAIAPDLARPHAVKGEILRQWGRFAEALGHLRRAVEIDPDDAWAVGTLGQVLSALGRPEAIEVLNRAVELNGDLDWVQVELADAYRLSGRLATALRHIERAIELQNVRKEEPQPWAWAVKGAILALMEQWEPARESLDRSITIFPEYGWALAVKASLHTRIGELPAAYDAVTSAIRIDPGLPWAWGILASVIERLDREVDKQLVACHHAVDLDPADIHLQAELGDALVRSGDPAGAEVAFRQALELFAGLESPVADVDLQQTAAWCRLRLHEPERALEHLGIAVSRESGRTDLSFDIGLALMCAGRWNRARTEYASAVRRVGREPHLGRRSALLADAVHNIRQLRFQGTLDCPDLDSLLDGLVKAARAGASAGIDRARSKSVSGGRVRQEDSGERIDPDSP